MSRERWAQEEAEAEELLKKTYGTQDEGPENAEGVEEKDSEQKPEEVKEVEEEKEEEKSEVVVPDNSLQSEVDRLKAELEKKEHSLSVLQGKYNAEVPRLAAEVASLREQFSTTKTPEKKESSGSVSLNDAIKRLREEYGEDFGKDLNTAMDEKLSSVIAPLQEKLDRAEKMVHASARDRYFAELNGLAPNWRKHYGDPRLPEYLNRKVPYTNMTILDAATNAEASGDARTVADIYLEFERSIAPAEKKETVETPAAPPKKKKEDIVAPTPASANKPTDAKKEYFTQKQLTDFARDVSTGKYRGRDTERLSIEARFDAAIASGRIL